MNNSKTSIVLRELTSDEKEQPMEGSNEDAVHNGKMFLDNEIKASQFCFLHTCKCLAAEI